MSDSSELSTLSILHDPGLTRPWENCAVFLISQTRNLQLNALPRAIYLARVTLEFEPSHSDERFAQVILSQYYELMISSILTLEFQT